MERALETLELYAHFCRATGIDDVRAGRDLGDPRREQPGASSSQAARERSGLEVEVLSRRGGGALRLPGGGQLDDAVATASCSTSAAARCSSRGSTDREARDARSWPLGAVRMTERFLADGERVKRKQVKALREHVAAELDERAVARRGRAA